jgi:hypothetical protein
MTIQEVSVERFAQLFHNYHQALADDSGSPSHLRPKDAWESVPPSEKSKLIAAARLAPSGSRDCAQRARIQAIFR